MDSLVKWGVGIVLGLVLIAASVAIVDQNKTCAVVVLGSITGEARTGFNLKWPLISSYDCYSRQPVVYQTVKDGVGDADFLDYPVEIKTSDGQTAFVEFNLSFHVDPKNVALVRSSVANDMRSLVTRVVANFSRSLPRDLGANYSASSLYTSGRVNYGNDIEEALKPLFAQYGVTLDQFELRDINFDEAYETAIENQQIARENIETAQFNAEQAIYDANRVAELARGDADAAIENARGEAESTRINAAAEADAIALRGEALEQYPAVLQLNFIEALNSANWMLIPWEQIQPFLPLEGLSTGQ